MANNNSLANLVDQDKLIEFTRMDDFLQVINIDPPNSLIKDHPLQKGVKYIPIDKIEMLLTKIFQEWGVEVLREGQMLNSVYVAIRLNYKHPITGHWHHQDGLGAVQIQVNKGESASNLAAIKSNAIMLGLPAAESFAVKDAAEKIGKVFGKDLNRREAIAFTPSYGTDEIKEELEERRREKRNKLDAGN